jgi:hypothetical protein
MPLTTDKSLAKIEAANLLRVFRDDLPAILAVLERQLNVLHTRAQVIIGFAAVAVTTTGFSGRLIAGTSTAAQVSIILGLSLVLLSCLLIFVRVMAVDWVISRRITADPVESVEEIIHYRNCKTRAYRAGGYGIFFGIAIYAVAIAIMLLNPEPLVVPVR